MQFEKAVENLPQDPILLGPWCKWKYPQRIQPPAFMDWRRKVAAFTGLEDPIISDRKPGPGPYYNSGLPGQCSLVWFLLRSVQWLTAVDMFQQINEVSTAANVNFECNSANQDPLWCKCNLEN